MIKAAVLAVGFPGNALMADVKRKPLKDPLSTIYRAVNGSPQENLQKLVEMMGGSIHVQSEWGKGTIFTVILPKSM